QASAQGLGRVQVAYVADVQQIEGAIGQGDGVTRPAPSCHLLLQFLAIENLMCDRRCPESHSAPCGTLNHAQTTWGKPPSAVRRSEAPLFWPSQTGASLARLDSRGRLSPHGRSQKSV